MTMPGYVVSTMVRALRELTGAGTDPADEAKLALYELTISELGSAVEKFDELATLARGCLELQELIRNSSLGAPR